MNNSDELKSTQTNSEDWVHVIRDEIDSYYETLKKLNSMEPHEVLMQLSSIIARAAEIRMVLSRSGAKKAASIRSREVEPLLDVADKLFKIHSRLIAVREMEFNTTRGQF